MITDNFKEFNNNKALNWAKIKNVKLEFSIPTIMKVMEGQKSKQNIREFIKNAGILKGCFS